MSDSAGVATRTAGSEQVGSLERDHSLNVTRQVCALWTRVLETQTLGALIASSHGRIVCANAELSRALCDDSTQLEGKALADLVPADAGGVLTTALRASAGLVGSAIHVETVLTGASSDQLDCEVIGRWVEVPGQQGKALIAVVLFRAQHGDQSRIELWLETAAELVKVITTHDRVRRQLQECRAQYRTVVNNSADGILICDADGAIAYVNAASVAMFGTTHAALRGTNVGDLFASFQGASDDLLAGLADRSEAGRSDVGIRRDGVRFPVHLAVRKVPVAGRPGICLFARDMSSSMLEDQAAQRAHKLEAIGTLASGVAHDFNNLLMGIRGCATIAMETLDNPDALRLYVEEILKSAETGATVAKQLLSLGTREGRSPDVLELNDVIASRQALLQRLLGEDVLLETQLQAQDSRVRADVGQLEQVLINLSVNARDAMPEGGQLTIETDMVYMQDDEVTTWILLRVTDTGCGMAQETVERAFDPFFSTKEVGRGTGLGLSTVYAIVGQLGGRIELFSSPGQGARFELLIPHADERITCEVPVPSCEDCTGQETVLLVEDERIVRMAIRHYLEGAGYRVLEAESGLEALECVQSFPGKIDLLLSDIVLPGMSGGRLREELRTLRPSLATLFMSAHSKEWLLSKDRIEEDDDTLQKPFGREELLVRVRAVLDSHHWTSVRTPQGTVLIVDDDPNVRRTLDRLLRDLGFQTIRAENGAEAILLASRHDGPLAAAIIDVVLPERMGVAVAEHLERICPGVRTIFISGYPREVAIQEELVAPDCLFAVKPVSPKSLAKLLELNNRMTDGSHQ